MHANARKDSKSTKRPFWPDSASGRLIRSTGSNMDQQGKDKGNEEEGIKTGRLNGGEKRRMERGGTKREEERRWWYPPSEKKKPLM